jgi:hypothetical protein
MEEATGAKCRERRTEATQMPNGFVVMAVFLESEKIGTYSRYLHAQPFFIPYEKRIGEAFIYSFNLISFEIQLAV